jgi:hypothetical protein
MKQVLSLFAMFALAMSLTTVNAQDKPKETARTAKSECSSAKSECSSVKAECSTAKEVKVAKKDGCCPSGATMTKKMASKQNCSDKCGDGCTMAAKTSTSSDAKKN